MRLGFIRQDINYIKLIVCVNIVHVYSRFSNGSESESESVLYRSVSLIYTDVGIGESGYNIQ
jgi:hypothetical protein